MPGAFAVSGGTDGGLAIDAVATNEALVGSVRGRPRRLDCGHGRYAHAELDTILGAQHHGCCCNVGDRDGVSNRVLAPFTPRW